MTPLTCSVSAVLNVDGATEAHRRAQTSYITTIPDDELEVARALPRRALTDVSRHLFSFLDWPADPFAEPAPYRSTIQFLPTSILGTSLLPVVFQFSRAISGAFQHCSGFPTTVTKQSCYLTWRRAFSRIAQPQPQPQTTTNCFFSFNVYSWHPISIGGLCRQRCRRFALKDYVPSTSRTPLPSDSSPVISWH